MPEEYPPGLDPSNGSSEESVGGQPEADTADVDEYGTPIPVDETVVEAPPVEEAPVAAAPPAPAAPAAPEAPSYAPPTVGMSDGLRTRLSEYLPEDIVADLASEMKATAMAASQQAVQLRDAEQSVGVPSEYLPAVRQHMARTQGVVADPRGALNAAVLMEIHARAEKSGDLAGEMAKYAQAARPTQMVPPTTPPPATAPPVRQPGRVEPLHADAQPVAPSISRVAVRQPAGAGRARNSVDAAMAAAFPELMEE